MKSRQFSGQMHRTLVMTFIDLIGAHYRETYHVEFENPMDI